ncbi:hypothetical protein [Frankia sp. Cas4]|uniref:hypothetical protein n=1 Tax=Frankia sp. Cas4 TaxID=3073927 RepID=UPI002AD3C5E9|nr:hypothetical protein [Frankia sp. Cas4]
MSFWVSAAEDLLAVLFWTAARTGLGMDSVVGWIQAMDKDTVTRLLAAFAAQVPGPGAAHPRDRHTRRPGCRHRPRHGRQR